MVPQQKPTMPAGGKYTGILAKSSVSNVDSTDSPDHEDQTTQLVSLRPRRRIVPPAAGRSRTLDPKQLLTSAWFKMSKLPQALTSRQSTLEYLHMASVGHTLRRLRAIGPPPKPQWLGVSRSEDEQRLVDLRSAWEKVSNRLQIIFQDSNQESEEKLRRKCEPFRFPVPGDPKASYQGQASKTFKHGISFWNCLARDHHDLFHQTSGLQARLKMQQKLFELIYEKEFQVFEEAESANLKSIVPYGSSMDDRVRRLVEYLEEFFAPFVVHPQVAGLARDTIFRYNLTCLCKAACELHNLLAPTTRHVFKISKPVCHNPKSERHIKYLRDSVRVQAETDALKASKDAASQYHGVLHMVLCGGLMVFKKNKVGGKANVETRVYEKRAVVVACLPKESQSVHYKDHTQG